MRPTHQAFTLIELVFVMLLLGLLGGLVAPRVSNIIGLSNKTHALKLSGFLQRAHQMAVLRSKNVQIVIDMNDQSFWVEQVLPPQTKPLLPDEFKVDEVLAEFRKEAENYDQEEEIQKRKAQRFEQVKESGIEPASLPNPMSIESVFFATTQERLNEGLIYIPISQSGYHPTSIIYLAHNNKIQYSLIFPALSSKVRIERGEVTMEEVQW